MSIAISVGATVAEGRLRSAGRIATKPEALELFGQSLDPRDLVALEVTGNAWAIARILEPHGARVIVVLPSDTGIRRARAKTDRLDARALARLCGRDTWMGWGPRMSASGRCAVGWRAARSWSVPGRARRTTLTRCWCAVEGPAAGVDLFGVKGRTWLAEQQLTVCEREAVDCVGLPCEQATAGACSPSSTAA